MSVDVTDHGIKGQHTLFNSNQIPRDQPSVYDVGPNVKSQQSLYLTGQNISSTLSQTLPRGFGSSKETAVPNEAPKTSVYAPKRYVFAIKLWSRFVLIRKHLFILIGNVALSLADSEIFLCILKKLSNQNMSKNYFEI